MGGSETALWLVVLAGMLRAATPVTYAAIGETINERSGTLNLGIEGLMLVGSCVAVATELTFQVWTLSALLGGLAAAVVGLAHAAFCVKLRVNQAVAGLAFLFFCHGATALYGVSLVGQPLDIAVKPPFEFLAGIPVLGDVLANQDPMVFGALLAAAIVWFVLFKTRWGIVLRACGESAVSAAATGIPVTRVRLLAGTAGGFLMGLGGAHLGLFYAGQWQENMVAGRGWIALVMVIFGEWRPSRVVLGAYLFGGLSALQLNLQARGVDAPQYLLAMLPLVVTISLLVVGAWRMKRHPGHMPADLGRPLPFE